MSVKKKKGVGRSIKFQRTAVHSLRYSGIRVTQSLTVIVARSSVCKTRQWQWAVCKRRPSATINILSNSCFSEKQRHRRTGSSPSKTTSHPTDVFRQALFRLRKSFFIFQFVIKYWSFRLTERNESTTMQRRNITNGLTRPRVEQRKRMTW